MPRPDAQPMLSKPIQTIRRPAPTKGGERASVAPPVWDKDQYPRIPQGRYLIRVVEIQGPEWMRNQRRNSLRLGCAVLDEAVTLSIFFNFGGVLGKIGTPGRQSKYYQHWTMANDGLPRKHQPMDWAIFLDKFFIAEVEDAAKNSKGENKPDAEIYSRIRHFVRKEDM